MVGELSCEPAVFQIGLQGGTKHSASGYKKMARDRSVARIFGPKRGQNYGPRMLARFLDHPLIQKRPRNCRNRQFCVSMSPKPL